MPKLPALPPVDEVIYLDIFDFQVGYVRDRDEYVRWVRKVDPEATVDADMRGEARHLVEADGSNVFVVHVPRGAPPQTIAHEAVHVAWYVLTVAGVQVDSSNHEVQAYLVGHITAQLTAFCATPKKRDKKRVRRSH